MENINSKFKLVTNRDFEASEMIAKPALTFWQDAWRRFKKNKVAMVAMVVVIFTLLFSVVSTFLSHNQQPITLIRMRFKPIKTYLLS